MSGFLYPNPHVAIACGGTGGHLFPGLAVAEELMRQQCAVTLVISAKEVDQEAVRPIKGMEILTLPAVGLTRDSLFAFLSGLWRSYRAAKTSFQQRPPRAALAMGGFTGAGPILAARQLGAETFLHESNTIPGRANRWLSRMVRQAFVGFPAAARRLHCRSTTFTGTPVRAQIHPRDTGACRAAFGLDPLRPVVLVTGGSQGAKALNNLVLDYLPQFAKTHAQWQWLHLTGPADCEEVKRAYESLKLDAVVRAFCSEMELALGAASAVISRAGASSLAELAAMRLPAVLVPYPAATDNHQFYNALAFAEAGAARLLPENNAKARDLEVRLADLVETSESRQSMQQALAQWHAPEAAQRIAGAILSTLGLGVPQVSGLDRAQTKTSGSNNARGEQLLRDALASRNHA
ncbi:MAG TPA: undecaprenyldiphospho-muramoylpentapeptide beta-N-acetylglucosaminyltransferase [Candidatus Limnocylindrales bacterium]|nr:undecaprenyldiphospho-muramoylpentapeptide beta-N-acetylglucosaminyltransferase [Candidatus Limnocylindrales bacterium]